MQNSMYSALFGALSNEHRMNSIANNLANVNTTGYKRDMLSFKDTFAMYAHDEIMEPMVNLRSKKLFPEPQHLSRTRIAQAQTDFDQGSVKVTGDPFDVAISGKGFFKVRSPQGDFYTRNGHFRMTGEGMLITEQGYPVLGNGGEITLPDGDTVTIANRIQSPSVRGNPIAGPFLVIIVVGKYPEAKGYAPLMRFGQYTVDVFLQKTDSAGNPMLDDKGGNVAAAQIIGKRLAEKAKAVGVEKVAFDRAGFAYHGRVKALADAAREAGLQF